MLVRVHLLDDVGWYAWISYALWFWTSDSLAWMVLAWCMRLPHLFLDPKECLWVFDPWDGWPCLDPLKEWDQNISKRSQVWDPWCRGNDEISANWFRCILESWSVGKSIEIYVNLIGTMAPRFVHCAQQSTHWTARPNLGDPHLTTEGWTSWNFKFTNQNGVSCNENYKLTQYRPTIH